MSLTKVVLHIRLHFLAVHVEKIGEGMKLVVPHLPVTMWDKTKRTDNINKLYNTQGWHIVPTRAANSLSEVQNRSRSSEPFNNFAYIGRRLRLQ